MVHIKEKQQHKMEGEVRVKWVKKANSWLKTTWKDGKQHNEWSKEKPLQDNK